MENEFVNIKICRNKHFVEDGNIITSVGISAGIDMALYLVKRYFGEEVSRATAKHMEYSYLEKNNRKIEI